MKKSNYSELTLRNGFFISESLQKKISEAKLVFIGCGLASSVATSAARLGFNHFVLVDGDTVDRSNLNRQDFVISDIGKNKAKSLAKRISQINEDAVIEVIDRYITEDEVEEIVGKGEIIINCADFNKVVYQINKIANEQGKISISPLNIGFGSIVTVFNDDSSTLSSMTGGVTDNDKKFLLNYHKNLKGYTLPSYIKKRLIKAFLFIAKKGFFPQNVIAANTSVVIILDTIIRYLNNDKIVIAPKPIAIDIEDVYGSKLN